jgi:hypothetical protein
LVTLFVPQESLATFSSATIPEVMVSPLESAADILGKSDNEIDKGVVYECMIRIAMAFAKQGGRGNSQQGALKHAIRLDPNRPEAYYHLSQYYESIKKYMDSYLAAEAGLRCDDTSAAPHLGYPGVYALIFQKAVAAWWWGRPKETKELHNLLANEYRGVMDDTHMKLVQSNLSSLGVGPEAQAFRTYLKGKHKLRKQFQFDWTADIERNNSQSYQDYSKKAYGFRDPAIDLSLLIL